MSPAHFIPGGYQFLLAVSNNLPWTFLFAPVLAAALLLTAFASATDGSAGGRGRSAGCNAIPPAMHRRRVFPAKRGRGAVRDQNRETGR
jgi:hypothetical protein